MKRLLWIASWLAASSVAQTNWPTPPQAPTPNVVPAPPLPGINVPQVRPALAPASPYGMPLTNAPARPKALTPPAGVPHPADLMRQGMQFRQAPLTATSIVGTQAVTYVEPQQPETPVALAGRAWHVSTEGSDENDGSLQKPFRTIQKAADSAQPGDVVIVLPGTYEGFETRRSGQPEKPITFKAQGEVVICSNRNDPPDHILIRGTDWIVIEGFVCRDAPRAGIGVLEASDVVLTNNVCSGNGVWGIFAGFTPRLQLLHNRASASKKQHGIYISNSRVPDDNPVLRGNDCFENAGCGIQLNGDCQMGGDGIIQGALLEGNVVHDNHSKGLSLISVEGARIQNNVLYHNGRVEGAAGIHLADEPNCGRPSRRNVVVNNTLVEPHIAAIRLSDGARHNIIFNNLIVGRGIADEVGENRIDADSNLQSDLPSYFFADHTSANFRLGYQSRAAYAGKATFAETQAPTEDIAGTPRSLHAPSVGAYDVVPSLPAAKSQ